MGPCAGIVIGCIGTLDGTRDRLRLPAAVVVALGGHPLVAQETVGDSTSSPKRATCSRGGHGRTPAASLTTTLSSAGQPTPSRHVAPALLNQFLPLALERRIQEFHERVVQKIYQLTDTTRVLDERLAEAALAQGALAAARSATEEHLEHLANATAHAMTTSDEREADHAMLLLRIAGDISASHVRLLEMYADPQDFAAKIGKTFEWVKDEHGIYPLDQVPDSLDPEFAANPSFVRALYGDLDRLGLIGDDSDESMDKVIDSGSGDPPTNMVTTLGRELLAFVEAPAHQDTS